MRAVIEALAAGRNVVVDNTNTTNEEVAPYLLVAAAYGATARIVRVSCDPETAWKRNTHGVPYAVVKLADGTRGTRTPETYTPGEGELVGGVLAMHERLAAYKGLPHWPQPEAL
jgi:predicted kinase